MTETQWQLLLDLIAGKAVTPMPVGFIIDSPWLPGWAGISTLDYFSNDELWYQANKKAVDTFSDVIFLPGFWAEFGMCTEPSAFGARCSWPRNDLPFAEKIIHQIGDIDRVAVPRVDRDGMAAFVLNRLNGCRNKIESIGHTIRFAAARGPWNIATFLMGTTEFLMAIRTDPEKIHQLLHIITVYTIEWLQCQKKQFDTIDGIFILDDIVGFCGPDDFKEFAIPYFKDIFNAIDASVKFFHNDADGRSCAPHLAELGINLFNFSFLHPMHDMKRWTDNQVVLMGNIPPRDVLALGTADEIRQCVESILQVPENTRRVLLSCGGGMPDGVSSDNIRAFTQAVEATAINNTHGGKHAI